MEENFLSAFSAQVTIISSLVAVAAVTICSVLTTMLTQRGARKTKQSELIFHEMVSACYDYLEASEQFSDLLNKSQITAYTLAFHRVSLFASPKTLDLLEKHRESIISTLSAKALPWEEVQPLAEQSSKIRGKLLQSMQEDLRK